MAQQQQEVCGFRLLLLEDDIKIEVPDIIKLSCFYCGTVEDVDILDSNKNTSPFICSGCYTIENCEKASEDTTTKVEVITSINWIHQWTFVQNPFCNYQCWLVQSKSNIYIIKEWWSFYVYELSVCSLQNLWIKSFKPLLPLFSTSKKLDIYPSNNLADLTWFG